MSLNINWDEVIKKEARGIEDYDLGEVHEEAERSREVEEEDLGGEIEADTVVTKKGVLDKDKFYLPKNLVETYDGHKLRFRVTKEEAQTYRRD